MISVNTFQNHVWAAAVLLPFLATALEATPWVSGVVTSGGSPIPATVLIPNGPSTTCAPDGSYVLERPDSTACWIMAHLPGYEAAYEQLPAGSADRVQDFDLVSLGNAPVMVQVVDHDNQPVPMARVDLPGTPFETRYTSDTGLCLLDLPLGTPYRVRALKLDAGIAENTFTHTGPWGVLLVLDPDSPHIPTAADAYGYRIADSGDPVYGPVHEWIDISSTGTPLPNSGVVTLPFQFRFYGELTNRIHVQRCCGYINPLNFADGGFLSNFGIPDPESPNGNVYSMWDRFAAGEGSVYYLNRPATGEFVVQFHNMRPVYTDQTYSWQVVVRNPTVWPTDNRHAEWVLHYPDGVPASCTIGPENPEGTAGVQYLYNGELAHGAAPVTPGTSLRLLPGDPVGRVQGVVRSAEDGAPLADVVIRCDGRESDSSNHGNYSMVLPEGRYTLVFERFGYGTRYVPVEVHAWQVLDPEVEMQPMPFTTLSGRITDGTGLGVAGARVRLLDHSGYQTLSGEDGTYSLALYDSATCSIEVHKQGLNELTRYVRIAGPTTEDFTLVQNPQWLPSPPDAHGYRAFDHNDLGGWNQGWSSVAAPGLIRTLNSSGYRTVILPFSFRFYGEEFDRITIYRHGFVIPGPVEPLMVSICNVEPLPSEFPWFRGIFGFHDCFRSYDYSVLYAGYSQLRSGFVIEFNNWRYQDNSGGTSFQIVILNPDLYPSSTGDASFLFSYAQGVNGSCTVGIDQHGGPDALPYLHDSVYADSTCSPLGPGSTLLITQRPEGRDCTTAAPVAVEAEPLADTYDWTRHVRVRATAEHPCGLSSIELVYRLNDGDWQSTPMSWSDNGYEALLHAPFEPGDRVIWKVRAESRGNPPVTGESPADTLEILEGDPFVTYSFDQGEWQGFSLGHCFSTPGWQPVHRGARGWQMGMNGQGTCRLLSPVMDFSNAGQVMLSFLQDLHYQSSPLAVQARLLVDGQLVMENTSSPDQVVNIEGYQFFDVSPWAAGRSNVQLEFVMEGNVAADFWYLDDITVTTSGSTVPGLRIVYTGRGHRLQLEWEASGPVGGYHVYSSPTPDGPWTLLAATTATACEVPLQAGNRFFQVRSVLADPVTQEPGGRDRPGPFRPEADDQAPGPRGQDR